MLVARDGLTLGELPAGARIGTGSPRRAAQLRALGLGLEVVADPRQRRHPAAAGRRRRAGRRRAGPRRAGPARPARRGHRGPRPAPDASRPRPGGAGDRVPRADDADADRRPARQRSTTPYTRVAVTAERSLLAALEAGCSRPRGGATPTLPSRPARRPRAVPAGRRQRGRRLRAGPAVRHRTARRRRTDRPRPRGRAARRGCGRSDVGARPVTRPKTTAKTRSPASRPRAASPSSAPAPATPAC